MVEHLFCPVKTKNCPKLTAVRFLQTCNDDLSHLEHAIHQLLGFLSLRMVQQSA